MRKLLQNETDNSYQKFYYEVRQGFIKKCVRYCKVCQVVQSVADCYYKVFQVLQSVTGCYYKVRQVLQSVTAFQNTI